MNELSIIIGLVANIVVLLGIIWHLATRLATIETNIKWLMQAELVRSQLKKA